VLLYTWHEAPEGVKGSDAADHPAVQSKDHKALGRLLTDLESAPRWEPKSTAVKNRSVGTSSEVTPQKVR
jgi:hypothetical protein